MQAAHCTSTHGTLLGLHPAGDIRANDQICAVEIWMRGQNLDQEPRVGDSGERREGGKVRTWSSGQGRGEGLGRGLGRGLGPCFSSLLSTLKRVD